MAKIGENPFTIIKIEDSDYTQGEETTKGVKITTKEEFDIDGNKINKFHTTRIAIVSALENKKIREDVNQKNNPLGPVKCASEKSKNNKNFFNLIDVKQQQ